MKTALQIILLVLTTNICLSQIDFSNHWAKSGWKYSNENDSIIDVSNQVIKENDLSYLLKYPYPRYGENRKVIPSYGLLGNDFRKIEILFTQIKQNENDLSSYDIIGTSKLGNKINALNGQVTFKTATAYVPENDDEYTVIVLVGSYSLNETNRKTENTTLIGSIKLILFTDNNLDKINSFDTDMWYEDGATRGFVGIRKTNNNETSESCLWGFSRFPYEYAKDFDVGNGEEKINIKYAKPWFNYKEEQWDSIYRKKPNGLFTQGTEYYTNPDEIDWYKQDKLNEEEIEKKVLRQLRLRNKKVARDFTSMKELSAYTNETIVIIPEIENASSKQEDTDLELTVHILIVNSITGKIKYHFKEHNLKSNAIIIDHISIDLKDYEITKTENAFGISVHYRSNSQPNPYESTLYSLYIKEDNELKKVVDHLEINESIGTVNMSGKCYAKFEKVKREILVNKDSFINGYYNLTIKQTDITTIFDLNSEGECKEKRIRNEKSYQDLTYNKMTYK